MLVVGFGPAAFHLQKFQASISSMACWAVVSTLSSCENIVRLGITDLGLTVYVARMRELVGGGKIREALLFPRYVFVDGIKDHCYRVRKTRGVCSILMIDGNPAVLPEKEMARLREREDRDGFIWLKRPNAFGSKFQKEQKVRVTAGAYSGFAGIHNGMSVKDREEILLSMFGRETRVQIPFNQLEAA